MTRNQSGIFYGVAFILFAVLMGGWHLLLTGISADFGAGVTVGALLAYGLLALLSRKVRELD